MEKKDEKEIHSTFEEDLLKLETIVKKLENGDVPLDDAIKEFQEAMNLAKKCDEKLKNAEECVQKILNEDGTITDFQVEDAF